MKLSEIKDEKALEVIANVLEPITTICADAKVKEKAQGKKLDLATYLLKSHPDEIMDILAAVNLKKREEYHCNPVSVLTQILGLLNDPDLINLFTSVEQTEGSSASASTK